jgi:D-alanine transaminase
MARISYVNGRYLPHSEAMVHIEDRGYQFADGIYEVILVKNGVLINADKHFDRLKKSLAEISINSPYTTSSLKIIIHELLKQNYKFDGSIYLQITRGVAKRAHEFPNSNVKPSLVITLSPLRYSLEKLYEIGTKVITFPDLRWKRRDIKSIALLPNILAKQKAIENNAREAWLFDENSNITEGSSSTSYIVKNNSIITHPLTQEILPGVTRTLVLNLAKTVNIKIEERIFSIDEAKSAEEAFLTSTTVGVIPIVKIDTSMIGKGKPGPITKKLIELYKNHINEQVSNARKTESNFIRLG